MRRSLRKRVNDSQMHVFLSFSKKIKRIMACGKRNYVFMGEAIKTRHIVCKLNCNLFSSVRERSFFNSLKCLSTYVCICTNLVVFVWYLIISTRVRAGFCLEAPIS